MTASVGLRVLIDEPFSSDAREADLSRSGRGRLQFASWLPAYNDAGENERLLFLSPEV